MSFEHGLKPGDVINNDTLVEIYKVSPQGGMRRSHKTGSLVIVSNHTRSVYKDRWEGNVFHYTGMGLVGDQSLDYRQNKTLAQSTRNGVEVYLFEVFKPQKYAFGGPVELAGNPYQERQVDDEGNPRNVWVFPLRLINE
jgi:5-methylcytosine-specific restriction protein A